MGIFVAVPFAAIRQWKQPSEARVLAVAGMSWTDFVATAEAGFTRDGCEVERLQVTGADFSLRRNGNEAVVRARRWKAASVGVEPPRKLQALRENAVRAKPFSSPWAMLLDKAWQFARLQDISLMMAAELAKLLCGQTF